jgi:hypothetical protein
MLGEQNTKIEKRKKKKEERRKKTFTHTFVSCENQNIKVKRVIHRCFISKNKH